ncbi:uncharacterized protein [Malus domestica]|uniref:uncharacterized protein n=1 Tax=Malus domestica TaxID=3750 RepID=UPI003976DB4E
MRHQSTVGFYAIEAESFKALKLEPRGNYRNVSIFASGAAFDGVSDLGSRHMIPASRHFRSSIFESSRGFRIKAHDPGVKALPQQHLRVLSG